MHPAGTDVPNSRPGRDLGAKSFPCFFMTIGCQLVTFWSLGQKCLQLFINAKSSYYVFRFWIANCRKMDGFYLVAIWSFIPSSKCFWLIFGFFIILGLK